jgi:tetratricopeptide (TPR) repeat protein
LNEIRGLLSEDRFAEAELRARRALDESPNDLKVEALLSTALLFQDKFVEALAHARSAVEHGPDSAEAHYVLSQALYSHRALDEALRESAAAIRLQGTPNLNHSYWHAWLTYESGDIETAEKLAVVGNAAWPADYGYAHLLSSIFTSTGRTKEAQEAVERGLSSAPDDPEMNYLHAYLLSNLRQHKDAAAAYKRFLELNPTDPELRDRVRAAWLITWPPTRLLIYHLENRTARLGWIVGLLLPAYVAAKAPYPSLSHICIALAVIISLARLSRGPLYVYMTGRTARMRGLCIFVDDCSIVAATAAVITRSMIGVWLAIACLVLAQVIFRVVIPYRVQRAAAA